MVSVQVGILPCRGRDSEDSLDRSESVESIKSSEVTSLSSRGLLRRFLRLGDRLESSS